MIQLSFILAYIVVTLAAASFIVPLLTGYSDSLHAHKFVSDTAKLLALITFTWFLHRMHLTWGEVSAAPAKMSRKKAVGIGVLFGIAIMGIVAAAIVLLEIRIKEPDWPVPTQRLLSGIAQAIIGGLLVGLIEELFFRGAILGGLLKRNGTAFAVVTSSLIYALLHFIEFNKQPADLAWFDAGMTLISGATANFANVPWDSAISLFLAGVLLALVSIRTGSIWIAVGIHAGWVMVIKILKTLTDLNRDSPLAHWVGDYDKTTGHLASVVLLVIIVAYWAGSRPPSSAAVART